MIDEWAASVKPKADPAIISKHIEKMVDVREKLTFFSFEFVLSHFRVKHLTSLQFTKPRPLLFTAVNSVKLYIMTDRAVLVIVRMSLPVTSTLK